jgi:hypothetical protein
MMNVVAIQEKLIMCRSSSTKQVMTYVMNLVAYGDFWWCRYLYVSERYNLEPLMADKNP